MSKPEKKIDIQVERNNIIDKQLETNFVYGIVIGLIIGAILVKIVPF